MGFSTGFIGRRSFGWSVWSTFPSKWWVVGCHFIPFPSLDGIARIWESSAPGISGLFPSSGPTHRGHGMGKTSRFAPVPGRGDVIGSGPDPTLGPSAGLLFPPTTGGPPGVSLRRSRNGSRPVSRGWSIPGSGRAFWLCGVVPVIGAVCTPGALEWCFSGGHIRAVPLFELPLGRW